ncbi:thermonuclease family protein [Paenibacillus sp. tmac-D7]|uniref:thermonuclease family protein n=1 Tax=Paenibacillus sp. tmac-D7 TaxID=2591462 RepID=UPI0011442FFE|nr:thermonuclease family protein [Paenibacillus sp. tmac-D7]
MMRHLWAAVIWGMIFVLSGCGVPPEGTAGSDDDAFVQAVLADYPQLKGKPYSVDQVKRVVDGDTFETVSNNKVRLIGVNTPESIGKIEPYGKEASEYTKKRLSNRKVFLFTDTGNTDTYGRLLRYVFVEGERIMYNELLVREGYANPMTVPPNVMYAKLFVQAERSAREQGKGLWAAGKKPGSSTGVSAGTNNEAADSTCANPEIKGNINARKEKIYHVPGGRYYEQTVPEQLFCSAKEAENAGYRKSKE